MPRVQRALLLFVGVALLLFGHAIPVAMAQRGVAFASDQMAEVISEQTFPLPKGCGGLTPAGQAEPPCCVNGFVYLDGQPVRGAEVTITNGTNSASLITQIFSDADARPHYRTSLSTPALNVAVGDTIAITARYGGREKTLSYTVRPGGQQVDIVLPRTQTNDYTFDQQIRSQAEPSKLNFPQGIAASAAGDIYVVDRDNARVQVFKGAGVFQRQWGTLGSEPGQLFQPNGVAVDASGNVYVVDAGNHRVQKFSSTGTFILSFGSRGSANEEFEQPAFVAIDREDNVYVTDTGNQRVQKWSSSGAWLATWGPTLSTGDQWQAPYGITIDPQGFVYVTDAAINRIYRLRSDGTVERHWGSTGDGTDQLSGVGAIAAGTNDRLYIADRNNQRIQVFDSLGTPRSRWGQGGTGNSRFTLIAGVGVGPNGNVYVVDQSSGISSFDRVDHRVQQFSAVGQWQDAWGQRDFEKSLRFPAGVAVDASGNVYVADTANDRIKKFRSDGTWEWSRGTYGNATRQFWEPHDIAIDLNGTLYVADTGNSRVQVWSRDGEWIRTIANMDLPFGVATDRDGKLYVADTGNSLIKIFAPDGTFIKSLAVYATKIAIDGNGFIYAIQSTVNQVRKYDANGQLVGQWGSEGSGNGQFEYIEGIATDASGRVYATDRQNHRVQVFDANGTWLYAWGRAGVQPGEFSQPSGITVGADGRVYVTDSDDTRIQVFRPSTFTQPIATVAHLNTPSLGQDDQLELIGLGQASDAARTIAGYEWASDRNGVLGTDAALRYAASRLVPGTHQLSFRVRDSAGAWSAPVRETIYVAPQGRPTWTMLLYLVGDYADGGSQLRAFNRAINTLRSTFRNPSVQIAVQVDGPANGDTRRLLFTPGNTTTAPTVTEEPFAEQRMDDPTTLADFLRWGQSRLPAEHYYLAVADHGQGIQGIGWDATSGPVNSAYLTVGELGAALRAPDVAPIDVLHLDACSMGLFEVAYEVRREVKVLLASQYLGWSYFAYDSYQKEIGASTSETAFAERIVRVYAATAQANQHPFTMTALDLRRTESTRLAIDNLAGELTAAINNDPSVTNRLRALRQMTQKLESNGDYQNNDLDSYVDVLDWAKRVQVDFVSPAIKQRASELITELRGPTPFILTHAAQSNALPPEYGNGAYIDVTNTNGVSLFYPLRRDTAAFDGYVNNRIFAFTAASRWPELLGSGFGALPGPDTPLEALPGPLEALSSSVRVYIPLTRR